MSVSPLRSRLNAGEKIFAAWMSSAHARMAEMLGHAGFDAVLVDLQHGEASFSDARDAIAAGYLAHTPVGVRVGLEGLSDAARLLDLGAEFAIMPMVNSAEDARRLVDALKFPPVGQRSWGPGRAVSLLKTSAEDYRLAANHSMTVLAMIETRQAIAELDKILCVPGLDGIFIGPSDLSISLSKGEWLAPHSSETLAVIATVLDAAKASGKIIGIYCSDGEDAARNAANGFDFMAIGTDWNFLKAGAEMTLKKARATK